MKEWWNAYRVEILVGVGLGIIFFLVLFLNNRIERLERYLVKEDVTLSNREFGIPETGPLPAISYDLPATVTFAGEEVPIDRPDLKEQLDKELQINIYFHSNTIFLIKRANQWLPQMQEILKANGIPDDFKYMPLIESGLLNVTSPSNAVGFWQFIRSAGKEFGLEINREVDERYDPIKSTEAACRYLNKAYQRFGNWTLVAASYNRGMSGLNRALDKQQVDNYYDLYLNEETSRYVFRMLALKQIIENPQTYGFQIDPRHLYSQDSVQYVEVNSSIKDLVEFAKESGTTYKQIKRYNPWLRDDQLTVRNKTYQIAIPTSK